MPRDDVEALPRAAGGVRFMPAAAVTPAPRRRVITARIWLGLCGLVAGALLVGVATLGEDPVDSTHRALVRELLAFLHGYGIPEWFGYRGLEFSANIVLFVPLGFFAALLLPLGRAWIAGVLATAGSIAVEVAQLVLLPARFASVLDVVANSLGGWIGVGLAVLLRVCVAARDKRLLREAEARRVAVPAH